MSLVCRSPNRIASRLAIDGRAGWLAFISTECAGPLDDGRCWRLAAETARAVDAPPNRAGFPFEPSHSRSTPAEGRIASEGDRMHQRALRRKRGQAYKGKEVGLAGVQGRSLSSPILPPPAPRPSASPQPSAQHPNRLRLPSSASTSSASRRPPRLSPSPSRPAPSSRRDPDARPSERRTPLSPRADPDLVPSLARPDPSSPFCVLPPCRAVRTTPRPCPFNDVFRSLRQEGAFCPTGLCTSSALRRLGRSRPTRAGAGRRARAPVHAAARPHGFGLASCRGRGIVAPSAAMPASSRAVLLPCDWQRLDAADRMELPFSLARNRD